MGTLTLALVIIVVLAIIGGGAGSFFGDVSQGVKNTISFVENSPTLKNLSQETQQFAQDQVSGIVKEIH